MKLFCENCGKKRRVGCYPDLANWVKHYYCLKCQEDVTTGDLSNKEGNKIFSDITGIGKIFRV